MTAVDVQAAAIRSRLDSGWPFEALRQAFANALDILNESGIRENKHHALTRLRRALEGNPE